MAKQLESNVSLETHRVWGIVGPRRSYKTTLAMQLWTYYCRKAAKEEDMVTLLVFTSDAMHRKEWTDAGMPPIFVHDLRDLQQKAVELRESILQNRGFMRVVAVLDQVYFKLKCRPFDLEQFSEVAEALIFTVAPEDFVHPNDLKEQKWNMSLPHALRKLEPQWLFSPDLSEKKLGRLQACFPQLKDATTRQALRTLEPRGFRPYPRWSQFCFQTKPGPKQLLISHEMESLWDRVRGPRQMREDE